MKHFPKLTLRWSTYVLCSALFFQSCELDTTEDIPDDDGDGVENSVDNCPGMSNPDQADANDDGIGDVCEGDLDSDGILDYLDNCPETANEDQKDFDEDGIGDVCDETTVEEDKTHIQSALDGTFNCIRNLKNGDAIGTILDDMVGLNNGVTPDQVWIDAVFENLGSVLDPGEEETSFRLEMSKIGGVYEFNKADSTWSETSTSDSKVELKFPTTEGGSNNASIVLDNYSDKSFTTDDSTYYLPTSAAISFTVDGTEVIGLSINEVVYGTGNVPLPTKVDVEIFLKPSNFHIVLESPVDTQFALDLEVSNEEGCGYGVEVDVELAHNQYDNINFETDIKSLTAGVHLEHLSVVTASNLASLFGLQDPTEAQINELVDLDLLVNGYKVADVEYNGTEEILYLIFKDDSKEDAFNYFESFFDDVIGLVESYTGELFVEEGV